MSQNFFAFCPSAQIFPCHKSRFPLHKPNRAPASKASQTHAPARSGDLDLVVRKPLAPISAERYSSVEQFDEAIQKLPGSTQAQHLLVGTISEHLDRTAKDPAGDPEF